MVDPVRLQREIDADMQSFGDQIRGVAPDVAEATLADLQTKICQFILQNPRRGVAWLQLLAVSPKAQADDTIFSLLFQTSWDLARLDADAARGRIALGSTRWNRLKTPEQQMLLSDVRALLHDHIGGLDYAEQLARLGVAGGDDLRRQFRLAMSEVWLGATTNFNSAEQQALATQRK